jgi:hypothetical protein
MCLFCMPDETGTAACVEEYADSTDCIVYCEDALCARFCEGECRYAFASESPTCTPGSLECDLGGIPAVCDPLCGVPGGCRYCYSDAECQELLGPAGVCRHHCGTCCVNDAASPYSCARCN